MYYINYRVLTVLKKKWHSYINCEIRYRCNYTQQQSGCIYYNKSSYIIWCSNPSPMVAPSKKKCINYIWENIDCSIFSVNKQEGDNKERNGGKERLAVKKMNGYMNCGTSIQWNDKYRGVSSLFFLEPENQHSETLIYNYLISVIQTLKKACVCVYTHIYRHVD